jgi:hypothetical protein
VGAYYWGKLSNGTMLTEPIRYYAGQDWVDSPGSNPMRWGDYSYTTLDPDGLTLWTIQEYAETRYLSPGAENAWGTRIVRLSPF